MTPSQWERIDALFTAALERPPEQWGAYLAAVEDSDLSGEVRSLLRAHEGRGRLDSIADELSGLRPAAASVRLADLVGRLSAALGDRYRVERELGRGGMAIVLLAHDMKHRRNVALKVLQPDLATSIGPARFLQEIAIAAQLAHPHILPLHDSGEAGGLLYYVMPYVEGESLRGRLTREGRLALADALQITREVADALGYAHRLDIVHRDIKPENILFEAGHAVVSDFGIARAMTAAGGADLAEAGMVVGTPTYMSPEQAAGGGVDGRSDLYSLGCVLYEMVAGEPPFSGATAHTVLRQHRTAEPPSLLARRVGVPEVVAAVVRRVLAKHPGDRFPTASRFAEALPLPGVPASRPSTSRGQRLRRRAGVAALLFATAIVTTSSEEREALENPAAYSAYLRGRHLVWGPDPARAIPHLEHAIALDSGYARAYAGLADAFSQFGVLGSVPPRQAFERARALAARALALDATAPEAHTALGAVHFWFDWDWEQAGAEYRRAFQLGRTGHLDHYVAYLTAMGNTTEAIREAERRLELDPLSASRNLALAWTYFMAGRHEASIEQLHRMLELHPGFAWAHIELAWNYAFTGRHAEAMIEARRAEGLLQPAEAATAGIDFAIASVAHVYAIAGERGEARRLLAELVTSARQRYVDPFKFAVVHAGLGDVREALRWLERAFDTRSPQMVYLGPMSRHFFARLRSEPRYRALQDRMRLPRG